MTMKLESLPNELLLDLFDYMSLGQILYSFQSLNSRFKQLTFTYQRAIRHLHLGLISMCDFKNFCRLHLPWIFNQIISITLTNGIEISLQTEFFFYDDLRLRHFINLQSLSLYHIHSQRTIKEIADQLDYLPHLTHINLINCCSSSVHFLDNTVINKIWTLPKLVHYYLRTTYCKKHSSLWPTVISPSLKYVSIQNFSDEKCSLYNLFRCTPHLRCLHVDSNLEGEYSDIPLLPLLVKFELNEKCVSINSPESIGTDELKNLLRKMPNLCHLSIESSHMFMDGYEWENFITNYLSKLKVFRCRMTTYFNNLDEIEQRVNNLLRSFRSHFWLNQHQCYIRCHWKSENHDKHYILYYTLPYIFSHSIAITDYLWSKSTSPYHNDHWPSDSVHNLIYSFASAAKFDSLTEVRSSQKFNTNGIISSPQSVTLCERISQLFQFNSNGIKSVSLPVIENELVKTFFTLSLSSTCVIPRFTTIRELSVDLRFDQYFWYFIPKLDQLISLNVRLSTDYTDLQILLDRAPNLYSLSVVCSTISSSKFFLSNIRSASIRKLTLKEGSLFDESIFYNIEQCVELSRSPLGKQCEILIIGVKERKSIVYLIEKMINLRLLNVQCYDCNYEIHPQLRAKCYHFVRWLTLSLPSTIKIGRFDYCENNIQLWVR